MAFPQRFPNGQIEYAGGPLQPFPSSNRDSAIVTYGAAKEVLYNDQLQMTPMCRAKYLEPTKVTIYSQANIPYDRTIDQNLANADYEFLQPRLVVTYGDADHTFTQDLPVGAPIQLVTSYVDIKSYLNVYGFRTASTPLPSPFFSTNLVSNVKVLVQEGDNPVGGRPISWLRSSDEITYPVFAAFALYSANPNTLFRVEGIQTSGTDLYLLFFQISIESMSPQSSPINGDTPRFCVPALNNVPIDADFGPEGYTFPAGAIFLWSTTPGMLTTPIAPRINHNLLITYRDNILVIPNSPGGI